MFYSFLHFLSILITYPLAKWILPNIKTRENAILFHITIGVSICGILFNQRILYGFLMVTISYFVLGMNPYFATFVAYLMNFLLIILQFYIPAKLRINNLSMIIFMKAVALSFNIEDGRRKKITGKSKSKRREDFSVSQRPSFVEWFAYCFTPFGATSTPIFEYRYFDSLLNVGVEENGTKVSEENEKEALSSLRVSIYFGLIHFLSSHYFRYSFYCSDSFLNMNIVLRIFFVLLLSLSSLIKNCMQWEALRAGLLQAGMGDFSFSHIKEFCNCRIFDIIKCKTISEWGKCYNSTCSHFWSFYFTERINEIGLGYTLPKIITFFVKPLFKGLYGALFLGNIEKKLYGRAEKALVELTKDASYSQGLTYAFAQIVMFLAKATICFKTAKSFIIISFSVNFYFWMFSILLIACQRIIVKMSKHEKEQKLKQD
ncbi:hypothetical protein TRFO_29365 [Tritrichomonas foetus]|uniref:MBOAT family protein n=1 Tax=Tritrichomonas foetus TaxID=1144522 RepID=A0A1J4JW94_9EUKA|nr:hypothetical protein TRFO_29365 [Tritrichomonas foetus]|eukprot:OHT03275.1 hypothetical protein TRFO_29365 [Tritrichomonas foetus]